MSADTLGAAMVAHPLEAIAGAVLLSVTLALALAGLVSAYRGRR